MTNKQEQIEEYLNSPIEVGETIKIRGEGNGSRDSSVWGNAVVHSVDFKSGVIEVIPGGYRQIIKKKKSDCQKNTMYIGHNPFPEKPWNSSLRIVNFDLGSILHAIGYERSNSYIMTSNFIGEYTVPELNWDPFVGGLGVVDERHYYQRQFVWTLKDKQNLINSIYNGVNIGSIVIRRRPWEWVQNAVKQDFKVGFKDVVDGKQRLNAISLFITDRFPDSNGYFYSDLSRFAQMKFNDFSAVSYGELGENATDQDVIDVFLGVNCTGVPMDQKHIDFVKDIKL